MLEKHEKQVEPLNLNLNLYFTCPIPFYLLMKQKQKQKQREREMKRPASGEGEGEGEGEMKKAKAVESKGLGWLDSNLVFEVLKHVDARTLAMAACVNREWHKTAQDERLWELICTKLWANTGCGEQQLRSVVLALGGFRRLLALYLFPLSKPLRLGKDELHLSLSLLSIRYFENINFNNTPT